MNRFVMITIALAGAAWLSGCQHHPVYPDVGSVYVISSPTPCEVVIDGINTKRLTPAKIDGLKVGKHQVDVMHFGYKVWSQQVDIEPGTTKRLSASLAAMNYRVIKKVTLPISAASDMAYLPEIGKAYVTHSNWLTGLSAYQISDSDAIWQNYIEIGKTGQGQIAASSAAKRIYVECQDTITAINLSTENMIKRITTTRPMGYTEIVFSLDGNWAITADSSDRSLGIIDTKTDSVVRYINLDGKPTDVAISPDGRYLFVTCKESRKFLKVNFQSGLVENELSTGSYPGAIFFNNSWDILGFCNMGRDELTIVPVDISSWAAVNGPTLAYGEVVRGACFSGDGAYVWVVTTDLPIIGSPAPLPIGNIILIYLSSWQPVTYISSGQYPLAVYQSPDGKFLYLLEYYDILVFRTDTE
ncbi:MAG: PEGA domain-containing protein [Candidatus Edwardsbacteria bacterium]|nr:PEGA domain-containing protein [Candidatus Edwardsbacteria bacterium]